MPETDGAAGDNNQGPQNDNRERVENVGEQPRFFNYVNVPLPTYDPNKADPNSWPSYVRQLQFYYHELGIVDDVNKRSKFLSRCHPDLFTLAEGLVTTDLSRTSYDEIIKVLTDHFAAAKPVVSTIVAYHDFIHLAQKIGQSASEYLMELKKRVRPCKFPDPDHNVLCQFVMGLRDKAVKQHLLDLSCTRTLTQSDALRIAASAEVALSNTDRMDAPIQHQASAYSLSHQSYQPPGTKQPVFRSDNRAVVYPDTGSSFGCYRCGENGHVLSDCPLDPAAIRCTGCGRDAHLLKACRSTAGGTRRKYSKNKQRQKYKQQGQSQGQQQQQQGQTNPQGAAKINYISAGSTPESPVITLPERYGNLFHVSVKPSELPSAPDALLSVQSGRQRTSRTAQVDTIVAESDTTRPIMLKVPVEDKPILMELDSGAAFTTIAYSTYATLWPHKPPLEPFNIPLWGFGATDTLPLLGMIMAKVNVKGKDVQLPIVVTAPHVPARANLLGRNWFGIFDITVRIEEQAVHSLTVSPMGRFNGPKVTLDVDASFAPIYLKARQVPFALRAEVELELDRLVAAGVLRPARFSRWSTPIVVVPKRDGSIRICGDYKATVNKALNADKYPMPTHNEAFAKVAGCTIFSKIDLEHAFMNLEVDNATAELFTINTIKGIFTVHRLPFGVSSAPGIFQRTMEQVLIGIQGVCVLLDDIIIGGKTDQEHQERLQLVEQRLQEAGLKTNEAKSVRRIPRVEFLGYVVDASGVHPLPAKVDAIRSAPAPTNKTDLQALLGLINFYDRFFPNKSTVFEPLYRLLDIDSTWNWGEQQEAALQHAKDTIASDKVLSFYDSTLPLCLSCDASPYGVGAVLAHIVENPGNPGHFEERPIAFASRTLTKAERNHSQIDREACAIMFAICKFHQYVYGRRFRLVTDHKPLLGLFKPGGETPQQVQTPEFEPQPEQVTTPEFEPQPEQVQTPSLNLGLSLSLFGLTLWLLQAAQVMTTKLFCPWVVVVVEGVH